MPLIFVLGHARDFQTSMVIVHHVRSLISGSHSLVNFHFTDIFNWLLQLRERSYQSFPLRVHLLQLQFSDSLINSHENQGQLSDSWHDIFQSHIGFSVGTLMVSCNRMIFSSSIKFRSPEITFFHVVRALFLKFHHNQFSVMSQSHATLGSV